VAAGLCFAYGATMQIKNLTKGWTEMSVFKIPNPPEGLCLELEHR